MITIRIEYDDMNMFASELARLDDDIKQIYGQMQTQCQTLQDGEWIGQGSNVFYEEFENTLTPALGRLSNALTETAHKINETCAKFDDAENECKVKIEISFN